MIASAVSSRGSVDNVNAIISGLRNSGMDEVIVFAGGIIPERDRKELFESGVRAIFGPGTKTSSVIDFLEAASDRLRAGEPVGVGSASGWHWN